MDWRRGARRQRRRALEPEDHGPAVHAAAADAPRLAGRARQARRRDRRRHLATIVAVLPFALPNVSLGAYLAWIELSSRNGLLLAMLRQNIEWAAFLLLPLLVSDTAPRKTTARARRSGAGSWPRS